MTVSILWLIPAFMLGGTLGILVASMMKMAADEPPKLPADSVGPLDASTGY
jgi:hypothetical protein